MLLALDTATTAVTVALHDGHRVIAEHTDLDARAAGELIGPALARTLADAGLDAASLGSRLDRVVVGTGPGPFTGLRVGIVAGATLALTHDLPVGGLCSLDALAHEVAQRGLVPVGEELVVATDARRKELYHGRYRVEGVGADACAARLDGPAVSRPGDIPAAQRALPVAGRGEELYPGTFARALPVLDVSAAALADLAARHPDRVGDIEPLYLRRPDAQPSAARKKVLL